MNEMEVSISSIEHNSHFDDKVKMNSTAIRPFEV
jgi:hypothetical protein